MHLTYVPDASSGELMQGDVLERTPELNAVLQQVHPHYHDHPKNLFFMVLSQTCDLVRREQFGGCKTPYIAIAPIRSLDLVVERHVSQEDIVAVDAELPVLGGRARNRLTQFIERLLNNNEPRYFYLDGADTCLPSDCVAFLQLSIPIKSELHFGTCLAAKRLQLTEAFQAKLGWLLGQMFSRVATEDWDRESLTAKVGAILNDAAIWVDDQKIKALEAEFEQLKSGDPAVAMSRQDIKKALDRVKTKRVKVLERTNAVIAEALGADDEQKAIKIAKRLAADTALSALLKS